jgi:uncharacterized pyridoxamine 5'-phosphate oxidase family protein
MHDINEVNDFLKEAGTYFLATMDGTKPRVRPFGTSTIYQGKLYIQTGKKKDVARQIAQSPRVELCAYKDGKWLRLSGTLVEDPDLKAQEWMLSRYPELGGMYKAGDGNTIVYYFTDATAVFSSFTAEPYTVKF